MTADRVGRLDVHYAALEGRVEDLRAALAWGEDPSMADKTGFTLLHFAAPPGQTDAARLPLKVGAELEARNMCQAPNPLVLDLKACHSKWNDRAFRRSGIGNGKAGCR